MVVEEIPRRSVAALSDPNVGSVWNVESEEVDQARTTSVCPELTQGENMETIGCNVLSHEREDGDRILQEGLSGSRVTSTPLKGL